jgi:hypothetical protein
MLLNLFHKMEREGTLPTSLYVAIIDLISRPDKDTTKKQIINQFP